MSLKGKYKIVKIFSFNALYEKLSNKTRLDTG